jgi:hypothetical protein
MLMLGEEAEFTNVGTTLFVKGEVEHGRILHALFTHKSTTTIYLGAGGLSNVRPEYVAEVPSNFPGLDVNLEVAADRLPLFPDHVLASLKTVIVTFVSFGNARNLLWAEQLNRLNALPVKALGKICTGGLVATFPLKEITITPWVGSYPGDKLLS